MTLTHTHAHHMEEHRLGIIRNENRRESSRVEQVDGGGRGVLGNIMSMCRNGTGSPALCVVTMHQQTKRKVDFHRREGGKRINQHIHEKDRETCLADTKSYCKVTTAESALCVQGGTVGLTRNPASEPQVRRPVATTQCRPWEKRVTQK